MLLEFLSTAAQLYKLYEKITFEKTCNRTMAVEVTQVHCMGIE